MAGIKRRITKAEFKRQRAELEQKLMDDADPATVGQIRAALLALYSDHATVYAEIIDDMHREIHLRAQRMQTFSS